MLRVRKILIVAILSAIAALYGSGLAYHGFITPISSKGELHKIAGDGWIQSGSEIRFKDLFQRGNRLELSFKGWRPEGMPPAQIKASVCGDERAIFAVYGPTTTTIPLKGECSPRVVSFEVVNPFVPSHTDQRELGSQIENITVTSKLGVPVVELGILVVAFLSIFFLSVISYYSPLGVFGVFMTPLLGAFFLSEGVNLQLERAMGLALFYGAVLLGTTLIKRVELDENSADRLKSSLKGVSYIALLIVGVGAIIRFYGLDFGFWFNYHPDELPKYNAIIHRMRAYGDLNPRYFLHPTLMLYMAYFMNNLIQFFGFPTEWNESLVFAGRVGSTLAGTISIYFTYCIGRRLYSKWVGYGAALLLAVLPLHVTCSRYLKEDALLTFFLLGCSLATIKAVQTGKYRYLLLGGLLGGMAASTKYTGALAVGIVGGIVLITHIRKGKDLSLDRYAIRALVLMPLTALACSPYIILDFATFLNDFGHEHAHMTRGHTASIDAWTQYWLYHFRRSILPGMTPFTALLSIVGLGVLIKRRRIEDLYVIALLLLFYLPAEWVKAKPAPQPERYVVPCLPFLSILAVEGCRSIYARFNRKVLYLIPVVLIGVPLFRTIEISQTIRRDTRDILSEWLLENVPTGARIAVDWRPYSVQFIGQPYQLDFLPRSRILQHLGKEELAEIGSDYLIMSSLFYDRYFTQPTASPAEREQIRNLFESFPIVKHVEPEAGTYGFHNPTLTLFALKGQQIRDDSAARAQFRWAID